MGLLRAHVRYTSFPATDVILREEEVESKAISRPLFSRKAFQRSLSLGSHVSVLIISTLLWWRS
uniref:Uncharacterized protein n=1 Tax=Lepeophtheirus salmonis TaxID=72036 RepID=A0A0K2V648_LEPSM